MQDPEQWVKASVRKLSAYVPGEQPKRSDIIKLNTNENPYPPAPAVGQLMSALSADMLRPYPNPTCEALREQVGALYGMDSAGVMIGNGSDEILALCTRAFVEDDARVGFFDPSYSLYPVLTEIRDSQCWPSALGPAFAWSRPDTEGCGLFMLANPNAPTGISYPRETVRSFCEGFNGVVVVDEAYAEFADENCLSLARDLPNVIVVRTLSKSYAMAGARLGYALGHPVLIEALMKIKDSYNVNAFTQAVAAAALGDQAYLHETTQRIRHTRLRLAQALSDLAYDVIPSSANFVFVRPPRLSAKDLFEALRERNILTRYFSDVRVSEYLRITVGTDADIDALLHAIHEIESS